MHGQNHMKFNLKKFILRAFPCKSISRIRYTPHVLRYLFVRHRSRKMRSHFPAVIFITKIKCIVMCTEETHCSAVHSCNRMTIKYTHDDNWNMLLTFVARDVWVVAGACKYVNRGTFGTSRRYIWCVKLIAESMYLPEDHSLRLLQT